MEEAVTIKPEAIGQSDSNAVVQQEPINPAMVLDNPELIVTPIHPNTDFNAAVQDNVNPTMVLENQEIKIPPVKPNKGYTNIHRYNVLLKLYIQAHPHLPRQMQYAEAQQVWRSVRMDPEGAYLEVLRSLHGMAVLSQNGNGGNEQELHPLLLQALGLNPGCLSVTNASPPKPSPAKAIAATPDPILVKPDPIPVKPETILTSGVPSQNIIPNPSSAQNRTGRQRYRPSKFREPFVPHSTAVRPGKRRGRPPKGSRPPPPLVPVIKRRVGRPRKNEVYNPVMHFDQIPVQEVVSTPELPTSTHMASTSGTMLNQTTPTLKTPSSLIITPVVPSLPQPNGSIPESTAQTPSAGNPDVNMPVPVPENSAVGSADCWEPQPGLSFVQGNGLKMILSRVNNGQPLPEFRRRRHRKKSVPKKQPVVNGTQPMDTTYNGSEWPAQGQAIDSTVEDNPQCESSPDQLFAAAILQYLLDLSELLGSAASFVISQEIEQKESVFSGWIVGEQNVGPKLAASVRLPSNTNEVELFSQLIHNEDFREVVRTSYGRVKPMAILILEGRKPGDLMPLLDDAIRCFKEWDLDSLILASQPARSLDNSSASSFDNGPSSKSMEIEQWKNKHLRTSQYCLQLVKCAEQSCCLEWRTPLHKVLPPRGFLPPPVPFAKGEQGPMAPRYEERSMATYGRLCERLVLESLIPRSAFQELPFDFYCPSARDELSRRVCFDCGHYFCTDSLRKIHSQLMHH